jgi:hypothetical protein
LYRRYQTLTRIELKQQRVGYNLGGDRVRLSGVSEIPEFEELGNLPPGVHLGEYEEFVDRFGTSFK